MELLPKNRVVSIILAHLPGRLLKDISIECLENISDALNNEFNGFTIAKSYFRENDKVTFDIKNKPDWPSEQARILNKMFAKEGETEVRTLPCTVMCLSGVHGLGNKDTEFYDIIFDDGNILYNVSGYHLIGITTGPEPKLEGVLKNGSKAIFSFMGLKDDWVDADGDNELVENADDYEEKEVEILSLDTYTELGDQDYEYYNVRFIHNGYIESGISGFHLQELIGE